MEEFVKVYRPYFRMVGWLVLVVLAWYVISQALEAINAPMTQAKDAKTQVSLTVPSAAQPASKSKKSSETEKRIGVVKVVVSPSLNIRSKPSRDSDLVGSVREGSKLSVLDKEGRWLEIIDSKGRKGWVSAGSRFVKVVWMKD